MILSNDGELPYGLKFTDGLKEAQAKIGKKPAWRGKEVARARWSFKTHSLTIAFEKNFTIIWTVEINLPY